jgi:hypothetical protein
MKENEQKFNHLNNRIFNPQTQTPPPPAPIHAPAPIVAIFPIGNGYIVALAFGPN